MLALERRSEILKLIQQKQTVTVSELSQSFGVTDETIRRDLERLESAGGIVRTYGGAMLSKGDNARIEQPSNVRKQTNTTAKKTIAAMAADLIQDGESVMLDDSSTSLFIARELKRKRNLTIITNSVDILLEVANVSGWSVMSTGGVLKARSMSFIGNQAEALIANYHVDKAIVSCKGLDLEHGFTESSEPSALVKRSMIRAAKQVILAVDHSKFDLISFVQIAHLDRATTIITDVAPDQRWIDTLAEQNVTGIWPG